MNKKNRRVREQIIDFLIVNFNDSSNWVREIDLREGYLGEEDRDKLRILLRNKLIKNEVIKLRCPILEWFNGRERNNTPSILVDIRVNREFMDHKCKISSRFGTFDYLDIEEMASSLTKIDKELRFLRELINLNYRSGLYEKGEK